MRYIIRKYGELHLVFDTKTKQRLRAYKDENLAVGLVYILNEIEKHENKLNNYQEQQYLQKLYNDLEEY